MISDDMASDMDFLIGLVRAGFIRALEGWSFAAIVFDVSR